MARPPKSARKPAKGKTVATLRHDAKRKNLPTAEYEPLMRKEEKSPIEVAFERRNRDLDPQLVWRGKDILDWSELVVPAPPLYIQEKVHPKVLVDDLLRQSKARAAAVEPQIDLFADFNGLPQDARATEFYQHEANWTNRMILGDSLQVMASLAEREGLRGKVQCIYFDPPYGIKFNSNFQWSTTSRDVKDGSADHITREPEQVKAFRDTWRDGIHSYLTYLRDRLTVARDLLSDSGSIFVQIGDENVHRVRGVLDEVFGQENCVCFVAFKKTGGQSSSLLPSVCDYLLWYSNDKERVKFRQMFFRKQPGEEGAKQYNWIELPDRSKRPMNDEELGGKVIDGFRVLQPYPLVSMGTSTTDRPFEWSGQQFRPSPNRHWSVTNAGLEKLRKADRLFAIGSTLRMVNFLVDYPVTPFTNVWTDTQTSGFAADKIYVVQTLPAVIERCILMSTDPGDLVLDPTCGSGTTAYVAEQWGRRWITIDTSRVALALARARIMGARYPFYLLADSRDGQIKEAEVTRTAPSSQPTHGNIRHGFVYERVPHITLKSIANNAEIDVIWDKWQQTLEPLREQLNQALKKSWQEWEIPRDAGDPWSERDQETSRGLKAEIAKGREGNPTIIRDALDALNRNLKRSYTVKTLPERPADPWPEKPTQLHAAWWEARIARQKEIDASIAAKAEFEFLYDKPYEDRSKVRVAGPFTVESLSPHRVLTVDENDNVVDGWRLSEEKGTAPFAGMPDFASVILENLKLAGVQQAHKEDRVTFTSLVGWPGKYICAEGRFEASDEWLVASGRRGVVSGECLVASEQNTSHQPLATSHQPLTTNRQPLATRRAAIFIGPEFGTVSRPDLVAAAREAADAGFDILIACAFNYDAHSAEFEKLGRIPVLKARMNPDLHMAGELKNTGAGNLFVVFGEPDIECESGLWLVARGGRLVANYEHIKELSGLGGLEEINRLGGTSLSRLKELSARGAVWPHEPSATGGGVSSIEHCGGSGTQHDRRVLGEPKRGQRFARGSGDAIDRGQPTGDAAVARPGGVVAGGGHDQQDARRAQAFAAIQALTAADFPLAQATSHYAQVTVRGVDIFKPQTGEVVSAGPEGIACWFIDTDYNEESFFVRHAYFLGQNDPYSALKTTLKAQIDAEAWSSLHSAVSRPFPKPTTGRIAVKVINHLGDEVMKVFPV